MSYAVEPLAPIDWERNTAVHDLFFGELAGEFVEVGYYRGDKTVWWLIYECEKNRWTGIKLEGEDPISYRGEHRTGGSSYAMAFDEKQRLLISPDGMGYISFCRLDLDNAVKKPVIEMEFPEKQKKEK